MAVKEEKISECLVYNLKILCMAIKPNDQLEQYLTEVNRMFLCNVNCETNVFIIIFLIGTISKEKYKCLYPSHTLFVQHTGFEGI